MTGSLGTSCYTITLAVKGETSLASAQRVVEAIISAIGMTPIFEPTVYQYASNIGIIYIQPIYESFIAYDAWPCHGGGYITVTSCKEYKTESVVEAVMSCGFTVIDSSSSTLGIE